MTRWPELYLGGARSLLDVPAGASGVTWNILFTGGDPDRRRWSTRWLKPGFRHVYAIARRGDVVLVVNGTTVMLQVDIWPAESYDAFTNAATAAITVESWVNPASARTRTPTVIRACTCVELTKALLGINAPTVLTPFQLYRYLREKAQTT